MDGWMDGRIWIMDIHMIIWIWMDGWMDGSPSYGYGGWLDGLWMDDGSIPGVRFSCCSAKAWAPGLGRRAVGLWIFMSSGPFSGCRGLPGRVEKAPVSFWSGAQLPPP